MDTNPPDSDSKWFKFFEEMQLADGFADIFKQPSGLSPEAENIPNLPGGRDYYVKLAEGKDPEWVKVYVHGDYGFVIDGRPVFTEYSDQIHCREVVSVAGVPIYRGWDFGLTPACTFSQMTPKGQFIVIDELCADDMGIDRFSDEVLEHSGKYYSDEEFIDIGDPAGAGRAQTDEKTCFDIMRAKGFEIEPGLQTLAIRLESVRKPLSILRNGQPGFLLHPRCKKLRKGFLGGYNYRRMQTRKERFADQPDKNEYSHPMDALQYVATRIFGEGLRTPKLRPSDDSDEFFVDTSRSDVTGY
ncbi:MAG: hypothetical protein WDN46_10275 [Methylocella sp.]